MNAAPLPAKDARWLEHPFTLGATAILGISKQTNAFLLAGVDFDYALPNISLGGTLGYQSGFNAALAARGRLHLGHAVALTFGGRAALVPLSEGGCLLGGNADPENCPENHWSSALFGGGELGVEGRSESGFSWRAGIGVMGMIARSGYSCTQNWNLPTCNATDDNYPGTVITQNVTLGHSF